MALSEPHAKTDKGLQAGALGLVGNIVIGLAATAPAYSLAATLGLVVAAVGNKAPAMFLLAFIPMLLAAFAYRELARDTPDCGTSFTWATKAFGPWLGWMAGWGLAISGMIVLANVAQVAAVNLLNFLHLYSLADSVPVATLLGSFFIVLMTLVSARGIVISERLQNVLLVIQLGVLVGLSVLALFRVFADNATAQSAIPEWSWLWPGGLDKSSIAAAVILCIFIYWGWDSTVTVNEESDDPTEGPGKAALLATIILVVIYVLVSIAAQAFAGPQELIDNAEDVLSALGTEVFGSPLDKILIIAVLTSAAASTQTTILPTARTSLSMAYAKAMPRRLAQIHPRYLTPAFSTILMGALSIGWYVLLTIVSENILADSLAALGLMIAFYYGLTGIACAIYYRRELTRSVRNFVLIGIAPTLGGLVLLAVFVKSAYNYWNPDNSESGDSWAGIGPPFVIGIGFLLLGVVLMLVWRFTGHSEFFRRRFECVDPEIAAGRRVATEAIAGSEVSE